MESMTLGMGFAALGFWLFVAAMVAVGVWDSIRKRETQHETLRRMVESGQPLDEALLDRVLSVHKESKDMGRDLRVGGWITLALGPGLAAFGWILGIALDEVLTYIMLAVAVLMLFISAGLFIGAKAVYGRDEGGNS